MKGKWTIYQIWRGGDKPVFLFPLGVIGSTKRHVPRFTKSRWVTTKIEVRSK